MSEGGAASAADSLITQARASAATLACAVVFAHNDLLSGNILVSDTKSAELAASEGGCHGTIVAEKVSGQLGAYSSWVPNPIDPTL